MNKKMNKKKHTIIGKVVRDGAKRAIRNYFQRSTLPFFYFYFFVRYQFDMFIKDSEEAIF